MADEIVDVVNENDKIIGKEWRSKCHREGLWHRIASVFLFNSEGKIWLQKRAARKEGAGMFDASASGHISAGESYEEGAYKEMQEELGIKTKIKFFAKNLKEIESQKKKHIAYVFMGKHDGPFKIQKEEVEDVQTYTIKEIKKLLKTNPELFPNGLKLELNALFKIKI